MKKKKEESKMKRKLALLLTVTMLATSVYTVAGKCGRVYFR